MKIIHQHTNYINIYIALYYVRLYKTGVDPEFSNRRGANDYVDAYIPRHETRSPIRPRSWGPLEGPGRLRVLYVLSCSLSLIWSSLIQNLIKKHSRSKFRGGTRLLRPPLDPPPGWSTRGFSMSQQHVKICVQHAKILCNMLKFCATC